MAAGATLRAFGNHFARLHQQRFSYSAQYVSNSIQIKSECSRRVGGQHSRLYSEAVDKTTVRRLDVVESVRAPYVSKYSTEGFNIRGNRVIGSIALLPTALLHWTVSHCMQK